MNKPAIRKQAIQKFRPVLSEAQITHILKLCRNDSTTESLGIIGILSMFEFKILQAAVKPAYTQKAKATLEESLGFSEPDGNAESNMQDDELHKATLYRQWLTEPARMSVSDLTLVRAYRYEHDMMNKNEEESYENELVGITVHQSKA